jgi:uncharacterized damage-inducible protein DinB
MLDVRSIQFLWQYMVHADREVIAALDTVEDTGFFAAQSMSWGSLAGQVAHAVRANEVWMERLKGQDVRYPSGPDQPTRSDVIDRWHAVHRAMLTYSTVQTEATLAEEIPLTTRAGGHFRLQRWAAMAHVADHATYHRGHLNTMIKTAGGTPSNVMLYPFAVSLGFGRAV